jgi:DNA-binding transcriptional MerR regulator
VLSCPLRSANGYRQYPREAVLRVQIIQQALQLGFSLDELAGIFRTKDNGGIPCHEVRSIAGKKLEALEERLRELTALRDVLKATLTEWDDKLSRTPSGERAHLLEGMKVITRKASKEKEFPHGRSKRAKA